MSLGSSKQSHLIALGVKPEHAGLIANRSVATGLTAAGSAITDALDLAKEYNVIATTASSTGVQLPDWPIGATVEVVNAGANTLAVYPHSASGTIQSGATVGSAGAAQSMSTLKTARFTRTSSTNWQYVALD